MKAISEFRSDSPEYYGFGVGIMKKIKVGLFWRILIAIAYDTKPYAPIQPPTHVTCLPCLEKMAR